MHDQPIRRDAPSNMCDAWDLCRLDSRCPNYGSCRAAAFPQDECEHDDGETADTCTCSCHLTN